MFGERKLVEVVAEIDEKKGEIVYHRRSWNGPTVTPDRFYPSKLLELVERGRGPHRKMVPDKLDLEANAPKDQKINAYILGAEAYFGVQSSWGIKEASPGPLYSGGMMENGTNFGLEMGKDLVSVTYCALSEIDLKKRKPRNNSKIKRLSENQ